MSENRKKVKAVVSAGFGNVVEWFDFAVYGYFASIISTNFFVSDSDLVSLLATFAAFAVGFFMRPLGAFVLGSYGDRVGRKKALSLTIIMMAVGTFMIGVLPTYNQIGIWAPILLVLARLIQGFSAGGEWGGSSSYMVEFADESSQGFWGSWQQVSTAAGLFLGSVAGLVFTTTMDPQFLQIWGWRIPFLIGGLIGLFGLYLRIQLDDTPEFVKAQEEGTTKKSPLKETFAHHKTEVLLGIGFTVFWTVSYYALLTYSPTFITDVVGVSSSLSFVASSISILILMVLIPIMGKLSDSIGRKPILITATISGVVLTYPLFMMMLTGSFPLILIAEIIFAVIIAGFSGPGVAAISEIFPTEIRYTSLSVGYNISTAAFGGTAPFISTALIKLTGQEIAPAYYIILSAIVTTFVLLGLKLYKGKDKENKKASENNYYKVNEG